MADETHDYQAKEQNEPHPAPDGRAPDPDRSSSHGHPPSSPYEVGYRYPGSEADCNPIGPTPTPATYRDEAPPADLDPDSCSPSYHDAGHSANHGPDPLSSAYPDTSSPDSVSQAYPNTLASAYYGSHSLSQADAYAVATADHGSDPFSQAYPNTVATSHPLSPAHPNTSSPDPVSQTHHGSNPCSGADQARPNFHPGAAAAD
ncbi:hypothetical protein N656DRAFT_801194 [Canariomyces notabilis]|uniref:Uncharacterized protein n=1 Tax=Canariomyces notabilis TaxID=2074819 RepID=A0AAN6QHV8_9PEZI|nr:hypothetical protein N656DRAFT_801194 [Canariomyces arenarius]